MTTSHAETPNRRRFELRKRIGAGAFGEVFLAEQVSSGGFRRPVALKLLNESAARMKEASRRMRDEARILGRLSHRHIVEVLDLVQIGDRWAVVMAYVPGADLEQVLAYLESQGRAVPGPAACSVGAAVGRALAAAWAATDDKGRPMRVVHRDIKPSNVRVTEDAEVKVLDFGVARVELEGREAQTRRPGLMGTERYMSPERLLLEGDGPPGDVYALAATVVELITGQPIGRSPVRDEAHLVFADGVSHGLRAYLQGPEDVVDPIVAAIRAALDGDPARRPDAATFARVMDEGARKLDGDSLVQFCAEVVGLAGGDAEANLEAASGTLIEGSSPPSLPTTADLLDADDAVSPAAARDRRGGPRVLALLVGLAALAVVGWKLAGPSAVEPVVSTLPDVVAPQSAVGASAAPVSAEASAEAAPPSAVTPVEPAPTPPATILAPAPANASTKRPERTSRPEPVVAAPPAVVSAAPTASAARVSRAMVVVADVSGIEVVCGDVRFHGTSSVRIVDFPAGACDVRAERGGTWFRDTIRIDAPREVACQVQGDALACR